MVGVVGGWCRKSPERGEGEGGESSEGLSECHLSRDIAVFDVQQQNRYYYVPKFCRCYNMLLFVQCMKCSAAVFDIYSQRNKCFIGVNHVSLLLTYVYIFYECVGI